MTAEKLVDGSSNPAAKENAASKASEGNGSSDAAAVGKSHEEQLTVQAVAMKPGLQDWVRSQLHRIADEHVVRRARAPHVPRPRRRRPRPTKNASVIAPQSPISVTAATPKATIETRATFDPADSKTANWRADEWKRAETAANYYVELNRLATIVVGATNEEKLRKEHPEMTLWAQIESIEPEKRNDFFLRLRATKADEKFRFVALFFRTSATSVKRWKHAWDKRQAHPKPDAA
jgi:hypothetical protein